MVRLRHPTAENLHMLLKLAYLTLCCSIQLLALLARGDPAKDLELASAAPGPTRSARRYRGRQGSPRQTAPTGPARRSRPRVPPSCMNAFTHPTRSLYGLKPSDGTTARQRGPR